MAEEKKGKRSGQEIERELESLHNEMAALRNRMTELVREWTGETVEDYQLKGPGDVPVRLSELFGERADLIVIHNMGRRCSYCTLWADGFNGLTDHLTDRAAFVVVSPDPPDVQKEFAEGRGWRFPMYSAADSDFVRDMGYQVEQEGKKYYLPGVSTFRREEDGTIRRVGRDFFGPGDVYNGLWHLFDLLKDGAGEWQPKLNYETDEVTTS